MITLCALVAVASCSRSTEGDDESMQAYVAVGEPSGDDDVAPLETGKPLEARAEEDREALTVILRGVAGTMDQPIQFEVVRAIDRPVYIDIDDADGPEQWITVAEIQDDDGEVLWTDRVNSLYQLLEYLELVLDQQTVLNLSVGQLLTFVDMYYPELLEFGVRVPLGIEGGTQYVLRAPALDGELYEVLRVDLDDLLDVADEPVLEGEPSTIVENGDPEHAVDIVILGDGYTEEQREKFELDAQAISERLFETEPFASHANLFNIHTVWTPAAEAGAGYDCTGYPNLDIGCKDDLRDTPFETVFVISALADKFRIELGDTSDRVAMPLQVARLYDAASAVPFDEIIMLSNTRRTSGFAGLYVSILTAYDPRISFPDTAVHELGHSFGVLGDEYEVEGDPCLEKEPRIPLPPNISATADREELKWSHWVGEDTPLPTPVSEARNHEVGAFEGTYNCEDLYRPSATCKMRSSSSEFCPVCSEQLVRRMFSVVDPASDEPFTAEKTDEQTVVFTAPVRDQDLIGATWRLGDEEIGTGARLELALDEFPSGWTALTVTLASATEYVRASSPRLEAQHTWWVKR